MGLNIKVKEDGFINLSQFKKFIDISKIVYYHLNHNVDKTLTLKFYDKEQKLIKPYKDKTNEKIKKSSKNKG